MTIRTDRPRIWLNPTTSTTLKARAAIPTSRMSNLISLCQRAGEPSWDIGIHNHLLAYQVTGNPQFAANAYSLMQQSMSVGLAQIQGDSYYQCRNYFPAAACCYDWLHAWMSPAQRAALQADLEACSDAVWPETNPSRSTGWAIGDPENNYYLGFQLTWMAGLALSGDSPKAAGYLTNARNRYLTAVMPALHGNSAGGLWLEGTNYGTSSTCSLLYALWAHSTATDENLMGEPWLQEALRSYLHLTAPDRSRLAPLGDQPQNSGAPLTDYDRRAMLLLATAGVQPGVAKQWLDTTIPANSQQRSNAWTEALFYPEETAAVDYTLTEPKLYAMSGSGVTSSRSDWSVDATQLVVSAGPVQQSHQDRAAGEFLLFRGDWLAAEAKINTASGLAGDVFLHNCLQIGTQPQVWTEAAIVPAVEDNPAYTFISADLTAAYLPQLTSYRRDFLFVKPSYLLIRDTFSGNSQPAMFWLQTLAQPVGNLAGQFQAGRLFGRAVTPGAAGTFAPYRQTTTQSTPSYRAQIAVTSPFVLALEAGAAGQAAPTLSTPQNTPGLSGLPCGVPFAGFVTGPGPFSLSVNAFSSSHILAGVKPSTAYTVQGIAFTSSPRGVLLFSAGSGTVIVSEGTGPTPLTLTAVAPDQVVSGQSVTLTGAGFGAGMSLAWGVTPLTIQAWSSSQITFTAPLVVAAMTYSLWGRRPADPAPTAGPLLTVKPPPLPPRTYTLSIATDGTPSITRLT